MSSNEKQIKASPYLGTISTGVSWLQYVLGYVSQLLDVDEVKLVAPFDELTGIAWSNTLRDLKKLAQLRRKF